jgi:hypothetical protein
MINKKRTTFYVKEHGKINSIEEMAELSGQSIKTVLIKRAIGASDDQIFNKKRSNVCVVYDKRFSSLTKCCQVYNANINNVRNKISQGATLESALNLEMPEYYTRKQAVVVRDKIFDDLAKAYNYYKNETEVAYETVKDRRNKGMTIERAIFTKNNK